VRDLTRVVEALLFTAEAPLKIDQILEVLPEASREEVEEVLGELRAYFDEAGRSIALFAVAGGYQMLTRPDVAPWVEKFLVGRKRQRLSRAALEVLAITAYRQPVTRGEIEAIRGVDCGAVLHTLLERRLVLVRGRAKRVGHPLLYVTTTRFLEHFGIEDLAEMPKLEEFRALLDRSDAQDELRRAGVLPARETPVPETEESEGSQPPELPELSGAPESPDVLGAMGDPAEPVIQGVGVEGGGGSDEA
jgi:segregation and condensation protein B